MKEVEREQARFSSIRSPAGIQDRSAALYSELLKLRKEYDTLNQKNQDLTLRAGIKGTVLATPYQHMGQRSEEVEEVEMQPILYGQQADLIGQWDTRGGELLGFGRTDKVGLQGHVTFQYHHGSRRHDILCQGARLVTEYVV